MQVFPKETPSLLVASFEVARFRVASRDMPGQECSCLTSQQRAGGIFLPCEIRFGYGRGVASCASDGLIRCSSLLKRFRMRDSWNKRDLNLELGLFREPLR